METYIELRTKAQIRKYCRWLSKYPDCYSAGLLKMLHIMVKKLGFRSQWYKISVWDTIEEYSRSGKEKDSFSAGEVERKYKNCKGEFPESSDPI